MAIGDVRSYYYTVLAQYLEEKQNLADFEQALREGLITEDKMQEAMEIVAGLETNYHRLAYIMYLFDMPNRTTKKSNYIKQNAAILNLHSGVFDTCMFLFKHYFHQYKEHFYYSTKCLTVLCS